jgi:thioredoxin reductase (NADPH)
MESYDLIILGAGGSGLAGAMYAARLGLKTLVLGASHGTELPVGGVITTTDVIENYPGFKKISGHELAKKLEEHAKSYKNVSIKNEKAVNINKIKDGFSIKTDKSIYQSKTILFATGTKVKKLEIPGSKEFENKGISYCALCDAPLYKNKTIAIIGGSDSAVKDALLISEYAKKVYIIYRGDEIHPEQINFERIKLNKKIEVINNTNIIRINGNSAVKSVVLDKTHLGKKELKLDGIFVAIGHTIISELAEKLGVKVNNKKEIIINHKTSETNVPGIFAAGDVTDKQFKQLITGVADACTAAYSAYEYITKEKSSS